MLFEMKRARVDFTETYDYKLVIHTGTRIHFHLT